MYNINGVGLMLNFYKDRGPLVITDLVISTKEGEDFSENVNIGF